MRFEISHQWEPGAKIAAMAGVSCTDHFRMPEAIYIYSFRIKYIRLSEYIRAQEIWCSFDVILRGFIVFMCHLPELRPFWPAIILSGWTSG